MKNSDYLIIGAGINGLLLARELATAGMTVTLVERGRCGKEASWAGGGIVSPLYPWRYGPAVTALASWSQDFYPDLADALLQETEIDPELSRHGLLMLDTQDEHPALAWANDNKRSMVRLIPDEFYPRVPALKPGFRSALWMEQVCSVRNPRLLQSLLESLRRLGKVRVVENSEVTGFELENRRVVGVTAREHGTDNVYSAGAVVVCGGAWSGRLLAEIGVELDVYPVKGQMLLYHSARKLIDCIVLTRGRYLIPRRDGHILVGSTLEHSGFDKQVTETARKELEDAALSLVPALKQAQLAGHWAGLRPGAGGSIPFIGKLPGYENLYVNAGHYRNGLLLAPASARLLGDILLGRQPIIDPAPFAPVTRDDKLNLVSSTE